MITVFLNDQKKQLTESMPLSEALKHWQQVEDSFTAEDFAIAINDGFIPRGQYTEVRLNEGDNIELLEPMQGG